MSITITLDQPQGTIYSAGDTVSGTVNLYPEKDFPKGQVHVDFAGRCDVEVTDYEYTAGHSSKRFYNKGHYYWPFAFTFPSTAVKGLVQSPRGKGDTFQARDTHTAGSHWRGTVNDDSGPHFLPSSFEANRKSKVKYYLRASFMPHEGRISLIHKDLTTETNVNFIRRNPNSPYYTESDPPSVKTYTYDCELRSFDLLPEELHRGHSFTDKVKSTFHTASTPFVPLRIITEFPTALPRDYKGIIPCNLIVKRLPAVQDPKCEYTNKQIPLEEVEITDLKIKLHGQTDTRAGGHGACEENKFDMIEHGKSFTAKVDTELLPAEEQNPGEKVIFTALGEWAQVRLPADLTESFSTYNIASWYDLTIELFLRARGEEKYCEVISGQPIEILPVA